MFSYLGKKAQTQENVRYLNRGVLPEFSLSDVYSANNYYYFF